MISKRLPSRLMPKFKTEAPGFVNTFFFVLILGSFVLMAIFPMLKLLKTHPLPAVIIIIGVIMWGWASSRDHKLHAQKMANSRIDESICTFTRNLDFREIDTWIIRAVYEEIQEYMGKTAFPLRPTDRLREDLRIDAEDLDMDVVYVIAQRTGRSMDMLKDNPYYDKVKTVGDVILFFNAQPFAPEKLAQGTLL